MLRQLILPAVKLGGNGADQRRTDAVGPVFDMRSPAVEQATVGYTNALLALTRRANTTDLRSILELIPRHFEGVAKVVILTERKDGSTQALSATFEDGRVNISAHSDSFCPIAPDLKIPLNVRYYQGYERPTGMLFIEAADSQEIKLRDSYPAREGELRSVFEGIANLVASAIDSKLDALTGLPVRRYFDVVLQMAGAEFEERGRVFSLVIVDIDHFKCINDTYGHQTGDQVLTAVANILYNGVRATRGAVDAVFRYGGEEFVILLTDVSKADAAGIAERLRAEIAATPFVLSADKTVTLTCTFGVADATDVVGQTSGSVGVDMIGAADARLYDGKRNGRDRVVAEGPVAAAPA